MDPVRNKNFEKDLPKQKFRISNGMDGILRCSRYSFGPNRLHYCGPDANRELKELLEKEGDKAGLAHLMKQFKTLFPYLKEIASANRIADPFEERVVEAYWVGNKLLNFAGKRTFFDFLAGDMRFKDKKGSREAGKLQEKIKMGAVPHHSFHVLNIWNQEGHNDKLEAVSRMGECLITWGKATEVVGPQIKVITEQLTYRDGKLALSEPLPRIITRQLESEYDIEQIKPGQIVSIHWGVPCEVITPVQASILRKYTLQNIVFANKYI
jgi:hypothetical protein